MHCEEIRECFADKLAGALSPEVDARIREHLAECSVCRQELAELEGIWQDLGQISVPPLQASSLRNAVLGAAEHSGERIPARRFTMKLALRAAAIIIVVAGLAAGASLWFSRQNASIPDAAIGQVQGPPDAPITLVEYGDYECPPCASSQIVIQNLLVKYPKSLKYEFRHLPLTGIHPNALQAALAAEAAGEQGKFWGMHRLLLGSQEQWKRIPEASQIFIEHARLLGLDIETFRASLNSPELKRRIQEQAAAAKSAGVEGVPTVFINGRKIDQAALTFDGIDELINQELRALKLRRANGK
jgi:protein-disulfide isomerase